MERAVADLLQPLVEDDADTSRLLRSAWIQL